MICKRILPSVSIRGYVKEYLLLHVIFDKTAEAPVKSYPVNPEEGMTFHVIGGLYAENPELGYGEKRPPVVIFGQPNSRQNLHISHEYMMIHVRFQPGAIFKLLKIPMSEFVHKYFDAELVMGKEIREVNEQLAYVANYDNMPGILDNYFQKKVSQFKSGFQPFDKIGKLILESPQRFSLEKIASEACLSHRQFEKRFSQQIGVGPKYFARICRFYQAYELKEFSPDLDWLSIALQTGYSDYQHLVKDFKQFAGVTPNTLIQESNNNPERRLNIAVGFRGV